MIFRSFIYRYDQLNRIKEMQTYNGLNISTNTWSPTGINDYKELINYDPNGNILTYFRNGASATGINMDKMKYHYNPGNNQLNYVYDSVPSGNYSVDIDAQVSNNYQYDAIGNLIKDVSEGITGISWNVYGKISSITKSSGTITYTYDASGNRISKAVGSITTLYVRDASGNVMSVYEIPAANTIIQKELHIYGSSRLGMITGELEIEAVSLPSEFGEGRIVSITRGKRYFELSNHLGNVQAVVSDKRISVTGGVYEADIVSATDYAPFGMGLVWRSYSSEEYRYGFNGKENDIETKTQDYGFRIYNPGLGKFLSVDPLTRDYPWYTPYQFAGNNSIKYIDLDGLEPANNPQAPGAAEKDAMEVIIGIETMAGRNNVKTNLFSSGLYRESDQDIKGTFSCGICIEYVTDTRKASADRFNMYVKSGTTLNVDESQAARFDNYEAFVVSRLMNNFVTGEGAENYNFPTNGIISSKFLESEILKSALKDFNNGNKVEASQYSFEAKELGKDLLRTGTFFSITGFVGSGSITITPTEKGLQVKIFNITSLTSGHLFKNPYNDSNWPKSYVREPNKRTPFGNISQTFNLFIPLNSPLLTEQ